MKIYQPLIMYIIIIPMIIISPFISLSMNSWFMIWITLELNLMTFIPFIIFFNKFYKSISMKYFIIQAFSSTILILSSNFLLLNYINNFILINILMNISILIKIGSAPFHSWFINMMNNLNWISCLILASWQKIIPMILLLYIYNFLTMYISAILSCFIGAIMGLNHQSLRLIISYSSINHIGWMLINLMISEYLWNLYFTSYFIMNFSIMMLFNKFKMFFINQMFIFNYYLINKIIIIFNFLSISGIPPLFGFMMKWFSLYFLNLNNNFIMIIILIIMSTLTFLFYSRICFSMLLQINNKMKLTIFNKFFMNKNNYINYMMMFNSFLNLWILSIWLI